MAERQNDRMAEWQNGRMVERQNGRMEWPFSATAPVCLLALEMPCPWFGEKLKVRTRVGSIHFLYIYFTGRPA